MSPRQIPWTKVTDWGLVWNGQRLPEPHREISEREFMRLMHLGIYMIDGIYFEQMRIPADSHLSEPPGSTGDSWKVQYFWFPYYGLAVATRYGRKTEAAYEEPSRPWKKRTYLGRKDRTNLYNWLARSDKEDEDTGYELRYFRLGCEHKEEYEAGYKECQDKFAAGRKIYDELVKEFYTAIMNEPPGYEIVPGSNLGKIRLYLDEHDDILEARQAEISDFEAKIKTAHTEMWKWNHAGRCYHIYHCPTCGQVRHTDSSD